MRIGSLFSGGCGGLELGLERAGVGHVVWQCEIDAAARRNLARHWPGVKQHEDVREVTSETAERVDVICGGFPCVDLSFAGKGAGLAGARSGLWFEYLRVIRELRPRFVVIENVPALIVRGLDVVLGGLAEAGYDAVWFTLRASDVGATHRRERLFIVGYANSEPARGNGRAALGAEAPSSGEGSVNRGVGDGVEFSGGDVGHANGPRLERRGVRGRGRTDERAPRAAGSEVADATGERWGEGRPERAGRERVAAPVDSEPATFSLPLCRPAPRHASSAKWATDWRTRWVNPLNPRGAQPAAGCARGCHSSILRPSGSRRWAKRP